MGFYPQQTPDGQYPQDDSQYDQSNLTYKGRLIGMWLELSEITNEFTQNVMKNKIDNDLKYEYFSKMRALWIELEPHVVLDNKGNNVIDDEDEEEFKRFERYIIEPSLLDNPENSDDIFKMHRILGKILRSLSVTNLDR